MHPGQIEWPHIGLGDGQRAGEQAASLVVRRYHRRRPRHIQSQPRRDRPDIGILHGLDMRGRFRAAPGTDSCFY
jgi:hypothetical protein